MVARKCAAIERDEWPTPRRSLVLARPGDEALLGLVSWYWESEETQWPGIAIFDPTHWGQDIGYEALGLWSDYLFRELPGIVRLDLRTWSGNLGMIRLAQKLGFQEEARFRRARIVNGGYFDGLAYGILRDEWQARYPDSFAAHLAARPLP